MKGHKQLLAAVLISVGPCLAACSSAESEHTAAAQAASALTWMHYHSSVTEDGAPAELDYWLRGNDVVRQYRQAGRLLYDERCEGTRVSIRELPADPSVDPSGFSYKETGDRESSAECFEAVTHSELDYLQTPETLGPPERLTLPSGEAVLRWVGPTGQQFIAAAESKLPVRIDYGSEESGGTATLAFGEFSSEPASAPPAEPEVAWDGFQDTRAVPASEAGTALGLATVPSSLAGLPLRYSWAYLTQNLSKPTYYLIWGDDMRNVQLISTAATLPQELLGFSADGSEYNTQEAERHVKVGIIGGDTALLQRALEVLRPEAQKDSRVAAARPISVGN